MLVQHILNRKAKRVEGVNATLDLSIGPNKYTVTFGRGNPAQRDFIVFDGWTSLLRGKKPKLMGGHGQGLLAFREMMGV